MKKIVLPVLVTLVVAISMYYQSETPKPSVCEPPDAALGEIEGFVSEVVPPSEAELTVLPADTRLDKRNYRSVDGRVYAVSLVIGGTSKSSLHRPELCLPSQGFLMTNPHTIDVDGRDWRVIVLDGNGRRPSIGFAYTFFNQDGVRTSSHAVRIFRDIVVRSFFNRIDRWVMVTVNAPETDDEGIADFLRRLKGFLR